MRRRFSVPSRIWLLVLALVCAAEVATHSGSRSGFLQSSKPVYSVNELLPGDGYVSWVGTTPVLHDSDGILTLASMFLGERGPQNTGILDRRAAYAYLASLAVPWIGRYAGFLVVNWLFWTGAAAAAYWFVRHRWDDPPLALLYSLLVATGHGIIFMAGVPMSYACAFAGIMLLLAMAEWLGVFSPHAPLRAWLLLGWAGGVAATLYFTHIPAFIYWWLYGLRRAPWRGLLAGTLLALAIGASWEGFGRAFVGLGFLTDNSDVATQSALGWIAHVQRPPSEVLTYFRGGPLAGAAAIRGTLLSAFPLPFWLLAAVGFSFSSRDDREWALAVAMGGLIPAIVILALLPLPRVAYYMYPAVYLCAARGMLSAAGAVRRVLTQLHLTDPQAQIGMSLVVLACLSTLIALNNADLLGSQQINDRFHNSIGLEW